jgi:hypothetical protein
MSRKRTPDQKSTETSTTETTTAVAEPPAAEAKADGPSFADRVGQKKWVTVDDPYLIAVDTIAGVRLFESKQDRQMAIKFDKKPPQAVIDTMHEARWKWKQAEEIWAHPVRADSAMSTRIEAERLFQEVSKMIRQEKGIEAGQEVPF